MTKSEKRQFKLFADRQAGRTKNKYALLFDAIDKQEEYDEEVLLRKHPSFKKGDFRSTKSYLYELILRSLRSSMTDDTPDKQIQYLIDKARLLTEKRLGVQAARQLTKAKKIARELERWVKLLEIISIESMIKFQVQGGDFFLKHQKLHSETMEILDVGRDDTSYYDLFMRVHHFIMEVGRLHSPKDQERLNAIAEHPLLADEERPKTFFSKMQFYETKGRICRLREDIEGDYKFIEKKIAVYDANPKHRKLYWQEYVYTSGGMLITALQLGYDEKFKERLGLLKKLQQSEASSNTDLTVNIFYAELFYLRKLRDYKSALDKVKEVESFLTGVEKEIDTPVRFSFYIAFIIIFIESGAHKQSLVWTGRLLGDPEITGYPRFMELSRLFNLINHFELRNERALESTIRSIYRYLKKKEGLHGFENVLLRFLRQLPGIADDNDLLDAFRSCREQLLALEPEERISWGVFQFNLITWLDSKIEGRSLSDVLREKEKVLE